MRTENIPDLIYGRIWRLKRASSELQMHISSPLIEKSKNIAFVIERKFSCQPKIKRQFTEMLNVNQILQ